MKWFWGLILLAAALAAYFLLRSPAQPAARPAPPAASAPTAGVPPRRARDTASSAGEEVAPGPAAAAATPAGEAPPPPAPSPAAESAAAEQSTSAAASSKEPDPASVPAAAPESVESKIEELADGLNKALGLEDATPKPIPDEPVPATADAASPPAPAGAASPPPAGPLPKAKLAAQADGSVLVDDKYVVKGLGTEAEPFLVSWEMLISAQDTYQPRLGRKEIPDRVKMLDGKWIKIAGYVAFPIMAQSQDEMLMMLNQWDGCCIGVPPTPYDAIEVKLKQPVFGDDRLRVSGSVKGILRVDPYLIKDWLVSLYLMDDGVLIEERGRQVERREPGSIGLHGGGAPLSPEPAPQ